MLHIIIYWALMQGSCWTAKVIGSCCIGHDLQPVEWVGLSVGGLVAN